MSLIARLDQADTPTIVLRTGPDGVVVGDDPTIMRFLKTVNVTSFDLGRLVTPEDGDWFLLALPHQFRSNGQGLIANVHDDSCDTPLTLAADRIVQLFRHRVVMAADAATQLPDRPGLYAVWATVEAWEELGLPNVPGRPLYIGKAEDSLRRRDGRTHFAVGRTGSSTLRRSLAALLRPSLHLHAMPRTPANPGYFSAYGLEPESDRRLQSWIEEHLSIGFWSADDPYYSDGAPVPDPSKFPELELSLSALERTVLAHPGWRDAPPPLNLKDLGGTTSETVRQVKAARKVLADEARAWKPS